MTSTAPLKILAAQLNPIMGDIAHNEALALAARQEAVRRGADLVVFSELFLAGYPPEDLVLKPAFQAACREALERLAKVTADGGPALLIGLPFVETGDLHNSVALLDQGKVQAIRHKVDLPNYGVFDEKRVFTPGPAPGPIAFRGWRLGVPICEDIWTPDVVETLSETGAQAIIVPNGSPYRTSVYAERMSVAVARVRESGLPLLYVNQMGGQDELVFDGASYAINTDLSLGYLAPAFVEDYALITLSESGFSGPIVALEEGDKADYAACVLGLRDYVEKNGFPGVVLGLSGGIDSALCAAMAVDALGPAKVHGIMMPYRYTSAESFSDAEGCAKALGLRYDTLPIAEAVEGLEHILSPLFAGTTRGITEENLQSRVRGTLLMSVSNKFGSMVVTTGNKSEMSVGYCTLYGDMNGGFNPIKDLYKMEVYRLSALRNEWKPLGALGPDGEVVPVNILTKAPTAELRENQKDQDSLPPYEVLDAVLEALVEEEASIHDIVARGHDFETVKRIERLLYLSEYKRRQAAPGVKVTGRNFGRDRRYPIVNRFRDKGDKLSSADSALYVGSGKARADEDFGV